MCGGVIGNALKSVNKVVKNPAQKILPQTVRNSSLYRNVGKPAVKLGTSAAIGTLTGGPAGGIAALATTALNGGLTDKGFQPVNNVVLPAAVGYTVGSTPAGTSFNGGYDVASNSGAGFLDSLGAGLTSAGETIGIQGLSSAIPSFLSGSLSGGAGGISNALPLAKMLGQLSGFGGGGTQGAVQDQFSMQPFYTASAPSAALAAALSGGATGSGVAGGSNSQQMSNQEEGGIGFADRLAYGVNPNAFA